MTSQGESAGRTAQGRPRALSRRRMLAGALGAAGAAGDHRLVAGAVAEIADRRTGDGDRAGGSARSARSGRRLVAGRALRGAVRPPRFVDARSARGARCRAGRCAGTAGRRATTPPFGRPVVPTFEIIATVASSSAGSDGDYSNEFPNSKFQPWIDAARAHRSARDPRPAVRPSDVSVAGTRDRSAARPTQRQPGARSGMASRADPTPGRWSHRHRRRRRGQRDDRATSTAWSDASGCRRRCWSCTSSRRRW